MSEVVFSKTENAGNIGHKIEEEEEIQYKRKITDSEEGI